MDNPFIPDSGQADSTEKSGLSAQSNKIEHFHVAVPPAQWSGKYPGIDNPEMGMTDPCFIRISDFL